MTNADNKQLVHIIDDDEAVRDAISLLLDSIGIENKTYENGQHFVDVIADSTRATFPECIVLDIRMPGMSGLECQNKLREMACKIPIIFVTGHGDVPMAVEAMKQGAIEFIQKPFRDQELLDKIQYGLTLCAEELAENAEHQDTKQRLEELTRREKQVLEKIIDGKSNKIIAADLCLSQRTVEIHRANLMQKLDVKSLTELIKRVMKSGSL